MQGSVAENKHNSNLIHGILCRPSLGCIYNIEVFTINQSEVGTLPGIELQRGQGKQYTCTRGRRTIATTCTAGTQLPRLREESTRLGLVALTQGPLDARRERARSCERSLPNVSAVFRPAGSDVGAEWLLEDGDSHGLDATAKVQGEAAD